MACILNPFFPAPSIALHLNWDGKNLPNSTKNDFLEGHVIIELKAPVDISQITVNLSGLSISRLEGSRHSQSHQVCFDSLKYETESTLIAFQFIRATQQVYPQCGELGAKSSKSRTLALKQHSFPFSLKVRALLVVQQKPFKSVSLISC